MPRVRRRAGELPAGGGPLALGVAAGEGARAALLRAHAARMGAPPAPRQAGGGGGGGGECCAEGECAGGAGGGGAPAAPPLPGLVVSVVLQRPPEAGEGEGAGAGAAAGAEEGAPGGRPVEGGVTLVESAEDGGCLCCAEGDAGLGPALRVALGLGLPGSDTVAPVPPAPPLAPGAGRLLLVEAAGASPWALAARLQELCLGWGADVRVCTVTAVAGLAVPDDCCCPEGTKDALELRCDEAEAADFFLGSRDVARDLLLGLNPRATQVADLGPGLWEALWGKPGASGAEGGAEDKSKCYLEPAFRFRQQLELPQGPGEAPPPGGAPPGWRAHRSRRPFSLERFCRLIEDCRAAKHVTEAGALQGDSSDIMRCRGLLSRGASGAGSLFAEVLRLRGLIWLDSSHLRARFWSQARAVARVGDAGPWWAACAEEGWPPERATREGIRALLERIPASGWSGVGDRRNEVWAFCPCDSAWEALSEALDACLLSPPEWSAYQSRLRGYCDPSGALVGRRRALELSNRGTCAAEEGQGPAKRPRPAVKSKFF